MDNNIHNYEDIIELPHPQSKKHPPMKLEDRAAQFAPFAALAGYEEAVRESRRLTDKEKILEDNVLEELDQMIQQLTNCKFPKVAITYFLPDEKKAGGSYERLLGTIKKIDDVTKALTLTDGTVIALNYITKLEKL